MSHDIKWLKDAEARMSGMQLAGGGHCRILTGEALENFHKQQECTAPEKTFEREYLGRFSCSEASPQTLPKAKSAPTEQAKSLREFMDEIFLQPHVEKNKARKSIGRSISSRYSGKDSSTAWKGLENPPKRLHWRRVGDTLEVIQLSKPLEPSDCIRAGSASKDICNCNSRDLFNFGCKCGYLKEKI